MQKGPLGFPVVDVDVTRSADSIDRMNRQTMLKIEAGLAADATMQDARKAIEETLASVQFPPGYGYTFEGGGFGMQMDMNQQMFRNVKIALVRYLSTGHLVYASGSSLMAVPFDPERGSAIGKPTPVVTDIRSEGGPGEAQFALSDDGTLVYVPGLDGSLGRLVWSDQRGTLGDTLPLRPSNLFWFRLSRGPSDHRALRRTAHLSAAQLVFWF